MRTKIRVALAATAVCALTIGTAVPAGAQEEPETLGFAVDKTEAQPGTLVLGKANAADVAEHCVTTVEGLQARFQELLDGPFAFLAEPGELFLRFFPDFPEVVFENHDQTAFALTALLVAGIAGLLGPEPAEEALPQTFVMTFADIATQEPIGERGNFDPNTGEGSVVVPDIEPGLWAVAAACVGPITDVDALEAAVRQSGDFLEQLGAPVDINDPAFQDFIDEFFGEPGHDGFDFLSAIAPTLLEPMMVPDAFGAVIFCILDDQGVCPDGEVEPPPGEPIEPTPGEEPEPAQPVVAAPFFTG